MMLADRDSSAPIASAGGPADATTAGAASIPAAGASAMPDASAAVDAAAAPADTAPTMSCPAGNYSGQFACSGFAGGISIGAVETTVSFTLQPSADRKTSLAVQNASLSLATPGGFIISGELTGSLDCETGKFQADIKDALVSFAGLPVPTLLNGSATGQLDGSRTKLGGDWSLGAVTGDNCVGTWNATLQP